MELRKLRGQVFDLLYGHVARRFNAGFVSDATKVVNYDGFVVNLLGGQRGTKCPSKYSTESNCVWTYTKRRSAFSRPEIVKVRAKAPFEFKLRGEDPRMLKGLLSDSSVFGKHYNSIIRENNKLEADKKVLVADKLELRADKNELVAVKDDLERKLATALAEIDTLKSEKAGTDKDGKDDGKDSSGSESQTIFTGLIDIISKAGVDSDIITGSWSSKRNKKGVFKTKFMLDDVPGAINLKGKTDSILGDSENTRTVGSGSLKMDYYSDGKMIAEASVLEKYKEKIFDFKKMNGGFRINRENDTMTMCDGCNGDFSANTILNAQFEVNI